MIIFLTILEIILIVGCVLVGYFADAVPVLTALQLPLTIICSVIGVFWLIDVIIKITNDIKGKR